MVVVWLGSLAATAVVVAPSAAPLHLLTTPPADLREHFGWPQTLDKADKARATWAALRSGVDVLNPEEAVTKKHFSPRLARQLQTGCAPVVPATLQHSVTSSDGTRKLLLELHDGLAVECVLIPISGKHMSLCVSSQVGCSRACAFCSTGTMGLVRNLSAEEILAQVWMAQRIVRECGLPKLVNVVRCRAASRRPGPRPSLLCPVVAHMHAYR